MLLYQLATAFYGSCALHVAAELDLAERLAGGPRTAQDLAAETGLQADALARVMRLLVGHGVFTEDQGGRFAATALGAQLRGAMRASVRLFAGAGQRTVWGDLLETVRSGEPALHRRFGVGPFEYFAQRPAEAAIFDEAMGAFTAATAIEVAGTYDFSAIHSVMDVGGGNGTLLNGVLRAHPRLRGTTFDLPRLADSARTQIAASGLSDRHDFAAGDFFAMVPAGFEVYLLKHVLHDWNDTQAIAILRNVSRALGTGGKALIIEGIYPAQVTAEPMTQMAAGNDCNMMLATGGRQRTAAAWHSLVAEAGLRVLRIVPTRASSIVEVGLPT
jgi:SAM-dependent methyltransferase